MYIRHVRPYGGQATSCVLAPLFDPSVLFMQKFNLNLCKHRKLQTWPLMPLCFVNNRNYEQKPRQL